MKWVLKWCKYSFIWTYMQDRKLSFPSKLLGELFFLFLWFFYILDFSFYLFSCLFWLFVFYCFVFFKFYFALCPSVWMISTHNANLYEIGYFNISKRKLSDLTFFCKNLVDFNEARLHEATLNLHTHVWVFSPACQ